MTIGDMREPEALLNMGSTGLMAGAKDMDHLDGAAAAFNYIRIADLVETLLENHSFKIDRRWRRNVLPRNLTGFSRGAKLAYGKYYRQIEVVDRALSAILPFSIVSGVIEVIAKKA